MASAISTDFKKWKYLGIAIETLPAQNWRSGRIMAGSIYKENGIYYFFYSASPPEPFIFDERIGLATSTDGIAWNSRESEIIKPDTSLYCYSNRGDSGRQHFGWRDPYVFKEQQTNKYYVFLTANSKGEDPIFKGCIGLAVSREIDGDYTLLPSPLYPVIPGTKKGIYYEMERPQVFYKNGKYHLFFSCVPDWLNPDWIKQVGRDGITPYSVYWYISDSITGPFMPSSHKPIVKGSENTGLYGTTFVEGPEGEMLACGVSPASYTLEISRRFLVHWKDDTIEIVDRGKDV